MASTILILALSENNEAQLSEVEKATVLRSGKKSYSVKDVINRTLTNTMNRNVTRQFKKSGFFLKHDESINATALRWYQCRVINSGPEEYCRKMAINDGITLYPENVSREIRVCDEAVGYPRRNKKREAGGKEKFGLLTKMKRLISKSSNL